MKALLFVSAISCYFCFLGCSVKTENNKNNVVTSNDSAVGRVEIYDKSAYELIDSNATITIIGTNFNWAEGPLWLEDKQLLLFTDVLENKVFQWKEGDTAKLYLTPSGYTNAAPRNGENGANGLALDNKGRLLLCQSGNRHVVRLNAPIDAPHPDFTILSSNYKGKKFNSPNDLVVDSKNHIYFTDPVYGLPEGANDATRELAFEGVYKISPDGKTTLLVDSISRPNGIALSPDEKTLYVASSDDKKPTWFAYNLDEKGSIYRGGILLDAAPLKEKALVKQGPDGMKIDKQGNIFSAGPDGINIISPLGKRLGLIKIYDRRTSNCSFNESNNILYVTADDIVLKVTLHPLK